MAKITAKEKAVHQQICDYIKIQYPNVIFTSDASGMRVGMGLRMELKRKRCANYKIPDLLILQPSGAYHGLLVEIKRDIKDLFTAKGNLKSTDQINEQSKTIVRLNDIGYYACFCCGFNHCRSVIDNYLENRNK